MPDLYIESIKIMKNDLFACRFQLETRYNMNFIMTEQTKKYKKIIELQVLLHDN